MNYIDCKDINFDYLRKLDCESHTESNLYRDKKIVYKIIKEDVTSERLVNKFEKLKLLSEGNILNNVVYPIDAIMLNNKFRGYTMKYIKNSIPVYDYDINEFNLFSFLSIIKEISLSVENIHKDSRKIIIGDLSFDNIIITRDNRHYFIDFDSCGIDKFKGDTISAIFANYLINRDIKIKELNQNTDKLSLILGVIYMLFCETIDEISMYEYDKLSEHISMLKSIRSYILEIKKTNNMIIETPYLSKII